LYEYSNTAVSLLRETLLNNRLDADLLKLCDFKRLLDYESDLDDPNTMVLDFCVKGLGKYEEYNKYNDYQVNFSTLYKKYESEQRKTTRVIFRKVPRRMVVVAIAVITMLLFATAVTAAMGYNIVDLIRSALNVSDKTATSGDNAEFKLFDNKRIYSSMKEMIESEKLEILFPIELPNNYKFTNFRVTDKGGNIELKAFSTEPYITFTVQIGIVPQIDNYEYETNGIKYNIVMMDENLYQAEWSDGKDYYLIVVGDKSTLSEIIKNLREVKKEEKP